ncbi:MAG: restriction endonuclease subunit S [Agathobacter rectalis]
MYHRNLIFSIKPQIFELKCVFSYFRLKTHITLLLPVYVHSWEQRKAIDIADYSKGNGYSKGDLTDAGTPIILYGRLYTKYQFAISEVDTFAVSRNGAVYSQGNEVIVPASGETADDIARASAVEKSGVLLGGDLNILRPFDFINPLFLALAISNGEPQKELAKKAQGKSVVHIHNTDIQEVTIAYPSRTEQDRIVSVFRQLDNLITLHQCKCQIDGCRFQSPLAITWEQRKVREVTDRYDNLRIPVAASLRVAGTTPYYGANGIQDYVDGYTHDGEFILVAEDGANDLKNYPVKCVKGRIWVNNHAHVLQGKYDCADNQFLAYAISQADIESLLVGGGRAKLNAETLMGIDLLLPNKAEQIRIGKYLAQLDNLITLHQCE